MEDPRVKVIVTENRGRGLAAARSVASGEELLVESAAVVGPVQSDEICCVSCSRDFFGEGLMNLYTLRRPVMGEVLSTRIWGVPPAGGPPL